MSYRLTVTNADGSVSMIGLRAETPAEAGSDVAQFLNRGARTVEVELVAAPHSALVGEAVSPSGRAES